MSKEIRTEPTLFGGERQVVYEDGNRVGEIKHEESFLHTISGGAIGSEKDVAYDNDGNRVSETTHETSLLYDLSGGAIGTSKSVTRDMRGNKISETRHNQGIFGNRSVIYEDGKKIGTIQKKTGIFGGKKRVIKSFGSADVEPLRRADRRRDTKVIEEIASEEAEPMREARHYSYDIKKALGPKAVKYNEYLGVYKCTRCRREFVVEYETLFSDPVARASIPKTADCKFGCSKPKENSFEGLILRIYSYFTNDPHGQGELISVKKDYEELYSPQ
jgi:hypothetical protein